MTGDQWNNDRSDRPGANRSDDRSERWPIHITNEHSWKILILCSKFGLFDPLFRTKDYFKLKFITALHHPLLARKPFHLFIFFNLNTWTSCQPWTFNQKVTFVCHFPSLILVIHIEVVPLKKSKWSLQNSAFTAYSEGYTLLLLAQF